MPVLSKLLPKLGPRIKPILFLYWRFVRGMTLGVRCVVFDGKQRVFLVRHTYTPGWHFPGGGVEVNETSYEALEKELWEEGKIELSQKAELFGLYLNRKGAGRDHVVLYVAHHWTQNSKPLPNHEIAESGFFELDDLPREITQATKQRLKEINENIEPTKTW